MVERAALEMRCTGNCTGGSNPSLSATKSSSLTTALFFVASREGFVQSVAVWQNRLRVVLL